MRLLSAAFAGLVLSTTAHAATIQRLSPAGGLGQIEFKHMRANAAGDFVAVTNTRVYIGNAAAGPVTQLATAPDTASFALGGSTTITTAGSPSGQVRVDAEVYDTRVDLNAHGDFVVATNKLLFTGNVREKTFKQVADSGSFTEFQQVKINDAGQYVAISDAKVYGGSISAPAATLLVDNAYGNFGIYDVAPLGGNAEVTAGEQRLALNAHGQFVAITGSAVYAGDVGALAASQLYQEHWIGFRHVELSDAGTFVIVAAQDVFSGAF